MKTSRGSNTVVVLSRSLRKRLVDGVRHAIFVKRHLSERSFESRQKERMLYQSRCRRNIPLDLSSTPWFRFFASLPSAIFSPSRREHLPFNSSSRFREIQEQAIASWWRRLFLREAIKANREIIPRISGGTFLNLSPSPDRTMNFRQNSSTLRYP